MTTLLPPLPSLTGRIEHRLQLDRTCNSSTNRSCDSEACGTSKGNGTGRKRPRSPSTTSSNHTSTSCSANNTAGFYLLVHDSLHGEDGALGYTEYLLVVPQALLKLACDAARFGHKVRTSSYHAIDIVIPHHHQSKEGSNRHRSPVKVLELEKLDIDSGPQLYYHNAGVLSLAEFFEVEHNLEGHNTQANKRPHHDRIYTIQAKVDSISPIIAAVPSDPFAMMELYDDTNDSFCWNAVAILKGACPLQCHPGIQPGDSIILRGVKRQRWHVPQSFAKHKDISPQLQHRAPTHVFVVTSCNSIEWDHDYHFTDTEPLTQCDLPNRRQESSLTYSVPPLPSTPVPLASIQGTVLSTYLTNRGSRNSDACIHKIILRTDMFPTMPNTLLAIYLTYFPMSPSLLLGLRGGAVIRAVNVHVVPTWDTETADKAFGTCLRSTITILKASSDYAALKPSIWDKARREEGHLHFKQDSKLSPARSICSPQPSTDCSSSRRTQSILSNKDSTRDERVTPPRALFRPSSGSTTGTNVDVINTLYNQKPFSFVNIKRTYDEYAFRAHLYRSWFTESGFKSNRSMVLSPSDSQVPKFDEIVDALLKFHANRNAKSKLSTKVSEEKQKQNIQESSQSKKTSGSKRRDPYAEFFDHACDEYDSNSVDKLIRDPLLCGVGCNVVQSSTREGYPVVLGLGKIRDSALRILIRRVEKRTSVCNNRKADGTNGSNASRTGGWTSSIHLSCQNIMNEMHANSSRQNSKPSQSDDPKDQSCPDSFYTVGFLHEMCPGLEYVGEPTLITDGNCRLPVSTGCDLNKACSHLPHHINLPQDDSKKTRQWFSLVKVHRAVVSCICIGSLPSCGGPSTLSEGLENTTTVSLPPYSFISTTQSRDEMDYFHDSNLVTGSSIVFATHGKMYCASVQLQLHSTDDSLHIRQGFESTNKKKSADHYPESDKTSDNLTVRDPCINIKEALCGDQVNRHTHGNVECIKKLQSITSVSDSIVDHQKFIVGRLVRQRYKLSKARNDTYEGCVLTLSHVPFVNSSRLDDPKISHDICTLQSIELKLSIPLKSQCETASMRRSLERIIIESSQDLPTLKNVVNVSPSDDQIKLAAAWWKMVDSGCISSIVTGGWDEFQASYSDGRPKMHPYSSTRMDNLKASENTIYLLFPLSARQSSKHGYMRFQCSIDEIMAFPVFSSVVSGSLHSAANQKYLHAAPIYFEGGLKFFPGMLDLRCRRRELLQHDSNQICDVPAIGEQLSLPSESVSGIPESTLADFHWDICLDVAQRTKDKVAPSLVRRIRRARMLGVTFCRAKAECTQCFKMLCSEKGIRAHDDDSRTSTGEPQSGVVRYAQIPDQKRIDKSFWNNPIPIAADNKGCSQSDNSITIDAFTESREDEGELDITHEPKNPVKSRFDTASLAPYGSKLRCPSGCHVSHGAIKWECSGVIDDGTGQAKLMADRNVVLTLLGAGLDVKSIEEGAWHSDSGIMFLKSVPPRSYVKTAVREAQSLAQELARASGSKKGITEADVFKLLTVSARAEFMLQHHCRDSKEPFRVLDFLCRCKPIADNAYGLNQNEVEVTIARKDQDGVPSEESEAVKSDVATYSLPPLKLNLVDCCLPSDLPNEEEESCWEYIRSLENNNKLVAW